MPDSPVRLYWGLASLVGVLLHMFIVPAQFAFAHEGLHGTTDWDTFWALNSVGYILDLFFLVNLYLKMFRFGSQDEDAIYNRPDDIFAHYMQSGVFLFDLLTVLPVDIVVLAWSPLLCSFLRVNRLFHLRHLFAHMKHFDRFLDQQQQVELSSQGRRLSKLLVLLLLVLHWVSCLWYMLGSWAEPHLTWFSTKPLVQTAYGFEKYIYCLYWAMTTGMSAL